MGGKRAIVILRQRDKVFTVYLFLHGCGQRTGSRSVRFRRTALENQVRVVGNLGAAGMGDGLYIEFTMG